MNEFLSNPSTLINPDSVYDQEKFINILQIILQTKTQKELSEQTGLNNATISRMLNGARSGRPYKSTIDKIAKAIDDPELIKELYDATGYSSQKIRERKKIIADNGFSPDLSAVQVHEKFFSTLMRGLSMMTSLHGSPWPPGKWTCRESPQTYKPKPTSWKQVRGQVGCHPGIHQPFSCLPALQ